jgi:hypothetical protein
MLLMLTQISSILIQHDFFQKIKNKKFKSMRFFEPERLKFDKERMEVLCRLGRFRF